MSQRGALPMLTPPAHQLTLMDDGKRMTGPIRARQSSRCQRLRRDMLQSVRIQSSFFKELELSLVIGELGVKAVITYSLYGYWQQVTAQMLCKFEPCSA
jgi:hypothetical protein